MAEYIDRQKAIDAVKRWGQQRLYLPIDFREMLESIPTTDVRPVVRGRWESNGDGFGWVFICSVCGFIDGHPFNDRMNYCPNCGADMRGESDG